MPGDVEVVGTSLKLWLVITPIMLGGLMPLLGVSDGTCAASRYSAGSAGITISACLTPTSAAPQTFFNLSLTVINSGLVNLTLAFYEEGSYRYNPFLIGIFRADGQQVGSFGGGLTRIVTGLTVGSSLSNRFDWIPLLGVSGKFTDWWGLAPGWDKPGIYFVQVSLGAVVYLGITIATRLFNNSYSGGEIKTPMIAYQVLDPLQPFSYFQIAVLALLSVNAVITVFILLYIRRLLSKRSEKSDKPQPKQE